ncbi:hypothetical protein C362_02365 [Cryptococcus neoformans Bt1]|nr:hypothetical protein C362_02365 [Cryptococcus neoformans var. grubii Bt1]
MPDDLDPASLASVLSAEYMLIDPTLIAALLSDYPPNTLLQNLDQIKEHLGILEATLVPDSDDPHSQEFTYGEGESWSGSDMNSGSSARMEALGDKMGRMDINWEEADDKSWGRHISGRNRVRGHQELAGSGSAMSSSTSLENIHQSQTWSGDSGDSREPVSECGSELEFSDEIDLLKSLFPNLTHGEIQKALSSEQSLPGAIDHLLSLDLIRESEQRGYWTGESEEVLRPVVDNFDMITAKKTKKKADNIRSASSPLTNPVPASRRKKKPKALQTIPLVDTLQRGARSLTPIQVVQPIPSSSSGRSSSPAADTKESSSATTSLATYLHELLPSLPISHFLRYLQSPEHPSLYHATRASLTSIPRSLAPQFLASFTEDDISSGLLQDVYGVSLEAEDNPWSVPREERERHKDLEMCIAIAGQDVATVMDLMDLLVDLRTFQSHEPVSEPDTSPPSMSSPLPVEEEQEDDGWAKPLAAPKRPVSSLPGPVTRPAPKASKSQKIRVVPGALPSSMANATDSFGVASPSPGMIKPYAVGGPHPTNWQTVRPKSRAKDRGGQGHPLAGSIPAYSRGATPHDGTPGSLYNHKSSFNGGRAKTQMDEYLYQVQVERARREAAIRAAGRSFAGGRAVRGAVSGHYAREAREAAERIRNLEMRAAELVIASQLDSRPARPSREENRSKMIDLHHLTVNEAVSVAEKAVDKWWINEREQRAEGWGAKGKKSQGCLVIVVGAGRHSAGNRGVLGPAVAGHLDKAGWRVDKGESSRGYLVVHGRK